VADVINVRKMMVDVDVATVENVLKVKSAVEEVEAAYVIIAENKIVSVVSLVINVMVPVIVDVVVAMVENVDEVVLVQDVVDQASVEVGPEDIKGLVLFFAYLSDK
jgi:hypothetical protein